jgi:hypothetical protein
VGSVGGFLTKLDSNGKLIWAIEDQPLFYFSLATDGSGKVYATGCFSGTGDFDPGPGVDIHSSPYHPDWKAYANCAFLAKYPPGGYW